MPILRANDEKTLVPKLPRRRLDVVDVILPRVRHGEGTVLEFSACFLQITVASTAIRSSLPVATSIRASQT